MMEMQRRSFLKAGVTAATGTVLAQPVTSLAGEYKSRIVVVHGTDIPKMVEAGMAKMGGWDKLFKPGMKVAIKPNLAWKSTPAEGANTHPDIVKAFVLAAQERKAAKISVTENTAFPANIAFPSSGVQAALKGTKARLFRPKAKEYQVVDIPNGKVCKKTTITRDIYEADCVINMPVAKHHSATWLSLGIKNWMGAVANEIRREWHRVGLNDALSDFCTLIKPALVVIDATRTLLNNGPQGPGAMAYPHEIIFSTDQVAADAYAATLFKVKPRDIAYIRVAEQRGIGCADLSKVQIDRVEV